MTGVGTLSRLIVQAEGSFREKKDKKATSARSKIKIGTCQKTWG